MIEHQYLTAYQKHGNLQMLPENGKFWYVTMFIQLANFLPKEPKQSSVVRRVLSWLFLDSLPGHSFKVKVKSYFILYYDNYQLSIYRM